MTVRPALALLLTILVTLSSASAARAQTLEAGVSIATSCKGSDGSFCNDTHSNLRTLGPYASVWFNDFIEVTGRVVWLDQPDINGSVMFPAPATFSIVERHRTLAQGEIVWHFLREKRVRLMFGLGAGRYWDREDVSCAPAGCEAGIAGLTVGRNRESHVDRSILVGLSVPLTSRLRLRGGWRYHNPFNDENALSEVFLGVGCRLF